MVAAIKAETRSYARRQRTYFRHQLAEGVALRFSVDAPLWDPSVDLSRETAPWLARVEAFLSGVSQ